METTEKKYPVLEQIKIVIDLLKKKTNYKDIPLDDWNLINNAIYKISDIHIHEKMEAIINTNAELVNKIIFKK